ncbi:MAG: hypothetical protein AAB276_06585, partial [Pseudomonadota bacterium]
MNNFPSAKTFNVTIPANSQVPIFYLGNNITVLSTTGAFKACPNNGTSDIELDNGLSYTCKGDDYFENVTFKNESGVAITA